MRHGKAREPAADGVRGQRWPDCDPAVREWVEEATERLCGDLEPGLVGAYLHGSLAAGAFHPPKSDVDLLFVVRGPLSPEVREHFTRRCVEVSRGRPLVGGLECSVVRARSAREVPHPMPFEAHFGEEHTADVLEGRIDYGVTRRDPDLAAHVQAVREVGTVLRGAPVEEVFGPVPRADFLDSVGRDLAWILEGDHLVESPVYGVLNLCRMLWVAESGSERLVPSKEEAALWALERIPPALRPVVRKALDAYRDRSWVDPGARTTAGRTWDPAELRAFRDAMAARVGE